MFDELTSSLLAHEDRINRSHEKVQEKAFQVKGESSCKGKAENSVGRGYGRGNFNGRSYGGSGDKRRNQVGESCQYKGKIQCRYCKKFGNKEADCLTNQMDEQNETNFTQKMEKESKLFMAHSLITGNMNVVWFIDSGFSNHMVSSKSLFRDLDES